MSREDEFTVCPYYRRDGVQTIHCEGIQDGCALHLGFADKAQMRAYKQTRCRDRWTGCMIAKMLNAKYDYQPPEAVQGYLCVP